MTIGGSFIKLDMAAQGSFRSMALGPASFIVLPVEGPIGTGFRHRVIDVICSFSGAQGLSI